MIDDGVPNEGSTQGISRNGVKVAMIDDGVPNEGLTQGISRNGVK